MVRNILVKVLLIPFSLLYGIGIGLRNWFYKKGLLKSVSFNLPVISVGNLTVGGAGKSPHIEYLVDFLSNYIAVATLSRGYKRKTKGFLQVETHHSAQEVGDEPLQFRRKFDNDIVVAVDENRVFGIPKILRNNPNTQAILLDDAFQHLAVKPGVNILLTDYSKLFTKDFLLPSGRLREWRSAYHRADIIIVSKCNQEMTDEEREEIIKEINPQPNQTIYFSYYNYGQPYNIFNPVDRKSLDDNPVLLVSAIANTDYLIAYLKDKSSFIKTLEFEDHHFFDHQDISTLTRTYQNMPEGAVILTTEKDAVRLELHRAYFLEKEIKIYAIPVEVAFHFGDSKRFNKEITDYLLSFKV